MMPTATLPYQRGARNARSRKLEALAQAYRHSNANADFVALHDAARYLLVRFAQGRTKGVCFQDRAEVDHLLMIALDDAAKAWRPDLGALTMVIQWHVRKVLNDHFRHMAYTVRVPALHLGHRKKHAPGYPNAVVAMAPTLEFNEGLDRRECPADEALEAEELRRQARAQVATVLARLPERFARVLRLRKLEGWTLAMVGGELGVSKERIRQIEAKAIEAFRREWRRLHGED